MCQKDKKVNICSFFVKDHPICILKDYYYDYFRAFANDISKVHAKIKARQFDALYKPD